MKARLNITIEEDVLDRVKAYATSKGVSVSKLIEEYFTALTRSRRRKDIVSVMEKLDVPPLDVEGDLKKRYYKSQASTYGF